MLPLAAASQTLSPEFMGLLVLGIMQLGNFWFNAAKNRRDEAAVTKAELKEVELRLDAKIIALDRRLERKTDQARDEIREDFQNVFKQLSALKEDMASAKAQTEITSQRIIAMESKVDALNNKILGKPTSTR